MPSHDFAALHAVIVTRFPDLAGAPTVWHTGGWHSVAADVADRWIFKFPRHAAAERALRTEASLLAVVQPAVTLPVPALELFSGPRVFSRHAKLRGSHLLSHQYEQMSDRSRARLAADLARFYGELHALDRDVMRAAGASSIESWLPPDEILRRTRHSCRRSSWDSRSIRSPRGRSCRRTRMARRTASSTGTDGTWHSTMTRRR